MDSQIGYYKTGDLKELRERSPIVYNNFKKPCMIYSSKAEKFFRIYIRHCNKNT